MDQSFFITSEYPFNPAVSKSWKFPIITAVREPDAVSDCTNRLQIRFWFPPKRSPKRFFATPQRRFECPPILFRSFPAEWLELHAFFMGSSAPILLLHVDEKECGYIIIRCVMRLQHGFRIHWIRGIEMNVHLDAGSWCWKWVDHSNEVSHIKNLMERVSMRNGQGSS